MFKETFIYKTKLSPEQIFDVLKENVEPPLTTLDFRPLSAKKLFAGKFDENYFEIWKTPHGRNSDSVQANGTILEGIDDTTVQVEIKMMQSTFIVGIVLLVLNLIILGFILWILKLGTESVFVYVYMLPFILNLIFFPLSYYMDKNKMKNRLKNMLKADLPAQKYNA